jgi:hypothetical protein
MVDAIAFHALPMTETLVRRDRSITALKDSLQTLLQPTSHCTNVAVFTERCMLLGSQNVGNSARRHLKANVVDEGHQIETSTYSTCTNFMRVSYQTGLTTIQRSKRSHVVDTTAVLTGR